MESQTRQLISLLFWHTALPCLHKYPMAYSEELAHRISRMLTDKTSYVEKQMFGGVAFMVNDKMCVGISRDKSTGVDRLMARVGPGFHHEALKRPGAREMDFAGRPMTGFIFIHPEGYQSDADLLFWIEKTLEYNSAAPEKPPHKRQKLVQKEKPLKALPPKPVKPVKQVKAKPKKKATPKKKQAAPKPKKKATKRK